MSQIKIKQKIIVLVLLPHGGLGSKIPIYGPISDQIHDFLFNRLIPSVKADAYKEMYRQYAQAHPDWTEDAIAYRAAQHTNNASVV